MSSKFKKQQQRKRWSEAGTVFPEVFCCQAQALGQDAAAPPVLQEIGQALLNFTTLRSTYAEIEALKGICAKVVRLATSGAFHDLVVEQVQAVATAANDAAALERSSVAGQQPRSSGEQPPMSSRAPLADVMVTLLEHPTLKLALRPCCVAAVQCLANGVRKVVGGGEAGRHIPPSVMDETQDAISSLYYLLVTYGSDIAMEGGAAGRHAILTAAEAMLEALQGASLAREALSSAAVALSAAARLPSVQPAVSALEIAEGLDLAPQPGMLGLAEGLQGIDAGIVAEQLAAAGTSLPQRLRQLSAFAKICALKGLVSMLPTAVLCAPLQLHHPQGSPHDANSSGTAAVQPGPAADIANGQTQEAWCWLSRGALPAACAGVLVASDAHYKFHAMSTLTVCLQRMKEILAEAAVHRTNSLQAPPSSEQADAQRSPAPSSPQSDGAPGRPAGSHEASGTEAGIWAVTLGAEGHDTEAGSATQSSAGSGKEGWDLQLPVLTAALRSQVMGLLWSNWDEPLSQTVKQVQAAFDAVLHILAVQQQYQRVLAVAQEDAIGVDAFLEHTTRDLLQTGGPRKGRYIPLTGLVPRLGAKRMLSLRPGLLEDTLSAQREQALCSCASGLFSALLQELRQECMQDADQPSEGLRAWREYWVGPMLHVLMSPNECLRSNASMYSLPVALQMDSGSLLLLLGYVLDEDAAMPACDVGGQALEDGLFEDGKVAALVAILKAARQLQLISDLDVVTVPGCGSVTIPESMLQRAISHCTESLRVDAMQLACVHPKATAPPGALELQLVALGLSLGMRCTSTSLRNKWMSLFGKLLRRIHTAVHAIVHRRHLRQLSMAAAVKRGKPDRAEVAALENAEELKDLQRLVAFMQWLTRSLLGSLYPGAPFERKYLATLLLNTLLEVRGEAGILSPAHEGPLDLLCPGFEGPTAVEVLLGAVVDSWDRLREGSITALMHMATPLPGLDRPELLPPVLGWACRLVGSPRVRESDAGARLLGLVYSKYILGLHWHVQVSCQSSSTAGSQSCTCLDEGATSAFSASMVFLDSINGWLQANVEAGKQDLPEACRNSLAHGVLLLLRYLVPAVPWGAFAGLPGQAQAMRRWLQRLLGLMEEAVQLTMEALAQPQKASIGAGEIDAGDLEVGLSDAEDEEGEEEGAGELAPRSQMITTGCWLTMKEVSLVWGTLARCIPLEGDEKSGHGYLLSAEQLQHIGASFITILTSMKHNGAVDKTQAGFIAMVEKLLRVPSPALNRLPGEWMANLLLHICRAGQSRDDIVRRSAGIPFAFCALFLAEPVGQHKVLLHGGMSALLDLAGDTAQAEPWPRVHAFNVLRMAFNDKNLAMDSSGFFAEGLKTAILGMSAPAWEVRNAASQLYTALVVRTLGFKNVTKGSTLRRTITGAEFFYRYQLLHSFLLGQLEEAAQQLESDTSSSSPVHPSLYPVLVLLSRLRPSLHNRSTALVNRLTPAAFTPVVQRCACARPLAIRHLAARALAPLVPPEELAATLADLLGQVPVAGAIQHANKVHGALLQLHALLEIDDQRLQAIDAHALLDLLLPALQQRMWLLTLRNPCGPIRLEFVRVDEALRCLGAALKPLVAPSTRQPQPTSPEDVAEAVQQFLAAITSSSSGRMAVSVRQAAVQALQASGLLNVLPPPTTTLAASAVASNGNHKVPGWLQEASLQAWLLAIQLMEDEADEVREVAAAAAAEAIAQLSGVDYAAPAGASAAASSALGLLRHWQPGSVRKLFDRELDNHHEEQLLLAQLAAGRLRALLMAASAPGLRPAVQGWADRVAQEVEMACQALQRLQQTTSWLGGVTNHPHTFGPLFRMLLALYAAGALAQRAHADVAGAEEPIAAPATGPAHQPHVAGVLSRCVDIMLKLQLHPLLSSLLVVALEQWDIADLRTQAVQALGEAYDPSFNPLFLVGTYMRHVPVVAAPTVAPQDTLLPHLASLTLDA
ncbi:hypothetical protein WJX72_012147 [[Myrmecia] bisecta]|uniref:DUF2428 domain-containing protein n=1 Tax=[Myrmecia] bisecta TaxID=41462 RepID=A0AAW1RAC3_9CHLO